MTMKKITYAFLQVLLILFFLYSGPVLAKSARSLVESGNKEFQQGDYAASLDNYEKAAQAEPDSAVVLFNKGDALYRQEKYDAALKAFEQAAAKALGKNDQGLEAQSRYNMGNSSYRRAEALGRQDLQQALDEYQRSSGYYQSALKLDPTLTEAAQNLEASRIAAKKVEEQIQRQQQQDQQEQQQKQEITKDLKNLQKEQQQAAEQSKDMAQSRQGQQPESSETAQQAENQKSITRKNQGDRGQTSEAAPGSKTSHPADEKAGSM